MITTSVLQQWVQALESGKYKQTKDQLQDSTGFCCLGVLCDIINPEGWYKDYQAFNHPLADTDTYCEMINEDLQEQLKHYNISAKNLAYMNDGGSSFLEIAEEIKQSCNTPL